MNAVVAECREVQQQMEHEDSEKLRRVSNGVQFLRDPRVRITSLSSKIAFLTSKGLSTEEICEAFGKAGEESSPSEIKRIADQHPVVPEAPSVSNSLVSPKFVGVDPTCFPRQSFTASRGESLYSPQSQLFSHVSQESRGVDWRDCVIAVGAALLGAFAALRAFQIYSPYEIRRKEGETQSSRKCEIGRHGGKSRRHAHTESGVNRDNSLPDVSALPVPVTPSPPNTVTGNVQGEVSRLLTELKETQEALETEKKSKAELSVTLGRLRGQLYAQTRTNEKQESTIQSLQKDIERLQKDVQAQEAVNEASFADAVNGVDACRADDAE